MDLSLALEDTHVLITGGTGFIGASTVSYFLAAGARVTSLDLTSPPKEENPRFQFFTCDISSEDNLASAFQNAAITFGPVATVIALASLDLSVLDHHESLADMDIEQWRKTHRINVEGTFLTARTWLRALKSLAGTKEATSMTKNVSLIIIGSESGWFGERGNADYAAGKSAVQGGLLKSLVGDVSRIWPSAR
jgi:NAD(P)-dependent dehydrogenase (short-subunit alcohol dehydrogenase family)